MRKGMKLLAALAAATTASAMSLSAFAEVQVNTTTHYEKLGQEDATVTVTSKVTGAQADEEVAFIVYHEEDGGLSKANNIVYIDQQTAKGPETPVEFNFTDSYSKVIGDQGAKIAAGTTETPSTGVKHNTDDDGEGGDGSTSSDSTGSLEPQATTAKLNWTLDNTDHGTVYQLDGAAAGSVTVGGESATEAKTKGEASGNVGDDVTFLVAPAPGYKLQYTLNSGEKTDASLNLDNVLAIKLEKVGSDNANTVAFEFVAETGDTAKVTLGSVESELTNATKRSATIFATATGVYDAAGMRIQYKAGKGDGQPTDFAALAVGSGGKFAVTVTEQPESADGYEWILSEDNIEKIGAYAGSTDDMDLGE